MEYLPEKISKYVGWLYVSLTGQKRLLGIRNMIKEFLDIKILNK